MNEFEIDKKQVRRAFSRAASDYDAAAVMQREVCIRMLEKLDYIKQQPARLLDVGSGTGWGTRQLGERYPKADITALDIALGMLQHARGTSGWWRKLFHGHREQFLCADVEALPLASGSVDMVWSNLALHWHAQPDRVFAEWRRALRLDGLLMFSCFGPDTMMELRRAFADVDDLPHVLPFVDMHDFGDMLVNAGFSTPVMDMEKITLTYGEPEKLLEDVRALGGNPLMTRQQGLLGRKAYERLLVALEKNRNADGRLTLTLEVVYGHAFRPVNRKTAAGESIVRFDLPKKSS